VAHTSSDSGRKAAESENGNGQSELTIDELARESGMSVRNIRDHASRGLLPPPDVRQRTGYYGAVHLERLKVIKELQSEGFNLKGIKRLLEQAGSPAERLLDMKQFVTRFDTPETPQVYTREELRTRFQATEDEEDDVIEKAVKLGALVEIGEDRFDAPSPALLDVAENVVKRGIPLPAVLEVLSSIVRHSDAVSRRFVNLFLDEVWKPFEEAGMPDERWPEVIESIEALRPIAAEALNTVFALRLGTEVEDAFGKQLARYKK
jgi:DNA-binding transcriptional MerR regulator